KINSSVFNDDPNTIISCMKLIKEEVSELEVAVQNKDYVETVDALCDIAYVVLGMAARIGIDFDKAFNLVHDNNMSKLCLTEIEAQDSVQHYKTNEQFLGFNSVTY